MADISRIIQISFPKEEQHIVKSFRTYEQGFGIRIGPVLIKEFIRALEEYLLDVTENEKPYDIRPGQMPRFRIEFD